MPEDTTGQTERLLEKNLLGLTVMESFCFLFLAGLNYILTADVAKKEKGQQPRVYFVSSGETMGQVVEQLQLSYMREKCDHYLAYVKVSPFHLFSGIHLFAVPSVALSIYSIGHQRRYV